MIRKDAIFPVGKISKPHGLKGELSFTTTIPIFDKVDIPFIILEPEGLFVPFYIENLRMKTDTSGFILLERIYSEEQAKEYTGQTIYLPNNYKDEFAENEVTANYFIGFEVFDSEKGYLGKITEIEQSTVNTLFVVSSDNNEMLIPVADEFIVAIDRDLRQITFTLPEGLMDL